MNRRAEPRRMRIEAAHREMPERMDSFPARSQLVDPTTKHFDLYRDVTVPAAEN
jgi:hypothetical protein